MFITDDPAVYIERAEMHEQLAAGTDDVPARKMHMAMAAEYRRKAAEITNMARPHADNVLKLHVAAG